MKQTILNNNKRLVLCETLEEFLLYDYQIEEITQEVKDWYYKIANGLKCNAFVDNQGFTFFIDKDCTDVELFFTIGHEIGHTMPRQLILNKEKRADNFGVFAVECFEIYNKIKQL